MRVDHGLNIPFHGPPPATYQPSILQAVIIAERYFVSWGPIAKAGSNKWLQMGGDCKLCGRHVTGATTRVKEGGISSQDVRVYHLAVDCPNASEALQNQLIPTGSVVT